MTLFALAFLSLVTPGPDVSPLAEDGHVHDWDPILEGEVPYYWLDMAWRGEYREDRAVYPVALVRMRIEDEDSSFLGDAKMAVNCKDETIGIVEGWAITSDRGEGRRKADRVVFDQARDPPDDTDRRIISFACEGSAAG